MKVLSKLQNKLNGSPVYVQTKALKDIICDEPHAEIIAIRKLPSGAVTIRSVNTSIDSVHSLCSVALANNYLSAPKTDTTITAEEYADRVAQAVLTIIKEGTQ